VAAVVADLEVKLKQDLMLEGTGRYREQAVLNVKGTDFLWQKTKNTEHHRDAVVVAAAAVCLVVADGH
jgi:hypothetical protein